MGENPNQHILSYLTYYVSSPDQPHYALMITGRWGAGKTWLIRQHVKSDSTHKYTYVSLYGAKTADEVAERIFAARHPILASKSAVIAGRLLKSVLKFTVPIDWDADQKDDFQMRLEMPDVANSGRARSSDADRILIFDDIERCAVDGNELWGLINQLIEHEGAKVILLSCEDEIKDESYRRTKEKNIGITLGVNPDAAGVLDSLIRDVEEPAAAALRGHRERILQLFERSGCASLRVLRFGIRDFCRIFGELPSKLQAESVVTSKLICSTLILSFAVYSGELKPSDIEPADLVGLLTGASKDPPLSGVNRKYSAFSLGALHPPLDWWRNFFERGEVRRSELVNEFTQLVSLIPAPDWLRLAQFDELSDLEFEKLLEETWESLVARKYRSAGAILHVAATHMWAIVEGVTKSNRTVQLILAEAKRAIDSLEEEEVLMSLASSGLEGAAGIAYAGRTTPEFRELRDHVDTIFASTKANVLILEALGLLRIVRDGGQAFGEALRKSSEKYGEAESWSPQQGALGQIDAEKFVQALVCLGHPDQLAIVSALYARLKLHLTGEREWVKRVVDELATQTGSSLQNRMLQVRLKQLIE